MLVRVYGGAAVSRETAYKWLERFRSGAESTEDEQRSGRPSTSATDETVSKINEIIRANKINDSRNM
jgi:transposase